MRVFCVAVTVGLLALLAGPLVARQAPPPGVRLGELAWPDAERVLTPEAVVVIPLGAASKEHGPHLRLENDLTIANYLSRRLTGESLY